MLTFIHKYSSAFHLCIIHCTRPWVRCCAANDPSVFKITEKAPSRDFSRLEVPTTGLEVPTGAFTLLRHYYTKRVLSHGK